jgi:hypothetical protein
MRRCRAWSVGVALFTLSAAGTLADASDDTVSAVSAEVEQVLLAPDGRQTALTTFTVLLADGRARVDVESAPGRSGYAEYQVYDFGRKRLYRVFPDDRIYFEEKLSAALASKAYVEGWAPRPEDLTVRTIVLKDDQIEGLPARLTLVERRRGRGRAPDYALVWATVPPGPLPLRVVYVQDGGHTVVLVYRRVETRRVNASSVAVPDAFVNLSPF